MVKNEKRRVYRNGKRTKEWKCFKMPIGGIGKVTVTFRRTTVETLRNAKKPGENWDSFVLSLVGRKSQGSRAICMLCNDILETEDISKSPKALAELNGWIEIAVKGRLNVIGFACPGCLSKLGAEK